MKILFYPHALVTFAEAYCIIKKLGIIHTNNVNDKEIGLAFYWNTTTISQYPKELVTLENAGIKVLNKIPDVSKECVDRVFQSVFGYSSLINPETHRGNCVKKTNTQAVHDGVMQMCPCKAEPKFIYQRIIDSRLTNEKVYDLRTIIVNRKIVQVTMLVKGVEGCFGRTKAGNKVSVFTCQTLDPNKCYSKEEIGLIETFAEKFGCDLAHLDIVRNNYDGKLFILDVNNISAYLSYTRLIDQTAVFNKVVTAFKNAYL